MTFESNSEKDTYDFGLSFGRKAKEGDIFALSGDLGVGKTVFTKGFAKGLSIEDPVTSPTFTIVLEYRSGRIPLFHFDAYRISDPDEILEIGFDEYLDSDGICLIEWPENIKDLLPWYTKWIKIEKDLEKGLDFRKITVT